MSLPWVRLDSNISTHPKVLWLVDQPGGWRAFSVYVFGLGYSGAHATDGQVDRHVLKVLCADKRSVTLLVKAGLWVEADDGWRIHNWDMRQELSVVTETKRQAQRMGAARTNCARYHGPSCDCWRESEAVGLAVGGANGQATAKANGGPSRSTRSHGRTYGRTDVEGGYSP